MPGDNGATWRRMRAAVALKVYKDAPHGLPDTHKDQLNADLLAFIKC